MDTPGAPEEQIFTVGETTLAQKDIICGWRGRTNGGAGGFRETGLSDRGRGC